MQATPEISDYSYMSRFNSIYARLATNYNMPFIPYILEDIAEQPLKFQGNNIFPNIDGTIEIAIKVVKQHIAPAITQLSDMIHKNYYSRKRN